MTEAAGAANPREQQKSHGNSSANEQGTQATHHGADFADRGGY